MAAIEQDFGLVDRLQIAEQPQECALAGATVPEDGDDFAAIYGEVDAGEHLSGTVRLPYAAADEKTLANSDCDIVGRQEIVQLRDAVAVFLWKPVQARRADQAHAPAAAVALGVEV